MVTFKNLTLKNFKSYKNTTINLENGITIIIGENGAGKSSIFEAISFALFKKSTTNISSLVRTGINENEKMIVNLEFNINGENYIVERIKAKSSSSAKLSRKHKTGEEILATGDRNVNTEITKILEIDDDLFLNAIYVRQGEIADLVNKNPADRKKLIAKLLNIEGLESSWNQIPLIINKYETQKALLKGKLSNEQELQYEINRKQELKQQKETEKNKNQEELKKIIEDQETNNNKLQHLEKEKEKYEELKSREDKETDKLKELQEQKQQLKENLDTITRNKNEIKHLEKHVNKLPIYKKYLETYHELEKIQEEKKHLKEKEKHLTQLKETIKTEKPYYDSYLKVDAGIKQYNEEKAQLENKLNHYDNLDKQRFHYQQELKNEKAQLNEFINEIKNAINDDKTRKIDEYKKIINHFEVENNEKIKKNKENLTKYTNNIAISKSKIKEYNEQLKELNLIGDECPVCKSQITQDKKEELANNYTTLIKQANKNIEYSESEIVKLDNEIEILEESQKNITSINNRFYDNQKIFENVKKHNEEVESLTKQIVLRADSEAELVKLKKKLKVMEDDYNALKPHYEKYLSAEGNLPDLGNENEINDRLYTLHGKNDQCIEKLKECIMEDIFLTENTPIEDVKEKINDFEAKKERYDQLKGKILGEDRLKTEMDELINKINIIKQNLKNTKESLSKTLYDEMKYQQLKNTNQTLSTNYTSISVNIGQIEGQIEELEKTIKENQEKIETNKALKKELEEHDSFLEFLEEIRYSFSRDGVQKKLRELSRPLIQKHTKQYFNKFNFNYSGLVINEDFSVSVSGPEGESNLDMVSGGEKIAIAIALRLGITQSMGQGGIDTILLDEPTVHLDNYRRQELVDIIRSINILPQMIIVTHDTELESAADNIISVVKENGVSTVKSI